MGAVLDVLLAVLLVGTGWASVSSGGLLRGVVLFVAFGLLMSLAWLRLAAPDLALAEAAVGTALTVVLLLDALARVRAAKDGEEGGHDD